MDLKIGGVRSPSRRLLTALLSIAAASLAGLPGTAFAQNSTNTSAVPPTSPIQDNPSPAQTSSAPAGSSSLGEGASPGDIVVTANKRQENLNDVPQSITALTGQQLAAKGVYNISDLSKLTPGLSFVDSGKNTPVFSLRGVGFFDGSIGARPTVSVYVDEAPIPFSIGSPGASFDLERVEILKGPQGTLFGQNSTGGAINFIAAKPTSTWTTGGTFAFSRFNTADFQGFVSGPLTSTLEARLAVRTLQGGDWQYSYTRDAALGQKDFTQGRLILDWRPVDRLKISLNANFFHDGSDTQGAQFLAFSPAVPSRTSLVPLLANYPVAPADPRATDFNPGQPFRSDNTFYQAILRADYDVSDALTITSLATYSHEDIDQNIDTDGTNLSDTQILTTGYTNTVSEELRASGRIGHLNYILGGSYEADQTLEVGDDDLRYSTIEYSIAPPPFPPLDDLGVNAHQSFKTYAAFANLDYQVFDKFVLHGGIRYTQSDLKYKACSTANSANAATAFGTITNVIRGGQGLAPLPLPLPGQCASLDQNFAPALAVGQLNQGNVSWRAGLDYKPRRGLLLYVNASKGYKAGSITASPNNLNAQFTPVVAESVLAYEAGIKASLLDNKVTFTGAAFYYDYRNKQLQGKIVFTPNIFGPINALVNVPKSRIQGAEAQLTISPLTGLSLSAGATYLDSKVTGDFQNYSVLGNPTNFNGNPFPYTPRWQEVISADYKHSLIAGKSAFIGTDINIHSHTTSGFGNEPQAYLPAYSVINLRVGVERDDGKWRAELFGTNITNAYYFTNITKITDSIRGYAGEPASYGVRFSFRY